METRRAESLFARAQELPRGADREAWLAAECGGDERLLRSVNSLLAALDGAGGFLETRPADGPGALVGTAAEVATRDGRDPAGGGAGGEAALQAAAFLRDAVEGRPGVSLEGYLAALPERARREARERIQAGLRLRVLRGRPRGAAEAGEEPVPQLAGFRIERMLGSGGLGVVYAARDEKLGRRVAIKVLRGQAGEAVRRRVVEEARKTAALSHPAIVTVHAVLDESEPPAIVMEWIEGYPIDRFAAQLSFEQKARLLRDVARGLAAAHERGLVHRDLKPDNILVGPELRPRILDFGLALSLEEAASAGGSFAGTPLYASPEQVRGGALGPASDVFSFGSLMFKVLTGRAPFGGESVSEVLESIATTAPPFLRDVAVGVPEDLQAVCLACLAWDPADRPAAAALVVELGRYLSGESVRLRPRLYQDLLRQRVSEHSAELEGWTTQGIVSREERDQLQAVHRRLLAEEDHWIIGARRLTLAQTVLYTGTWIVVVAAGLLVWLGRDDLPPLARWLAPLFATLGLLGMGWLAERRRETLASASFLAGAALSLVPTLLSLFKEAGWLAVAPAGVGQLFGETFSNRQLFLACLASLAVSGFALARLRLTGFAWTTTVLGVGTYLAGLMELGWLDRPLHVQAAWCLPLVLAEVGALAFERAGRVRWSLPLHLVALGTLVAATDAIAYDGPTLSWLGLGAGGGYWTTDRLRAFSLALNGAVFLGLMLATERSRSLDLRRGSRALEVLALLHAEGALFANANGNRSDPEVARDVVVYLVAAVAFLVLGAWRARWRLLVGALAALALGSYLLVDLHLVPRTPFILGLGLAGMAVAVLAFGYLRLPSRGNRPGSGRSGG